MAVYEGFRNQFTSLETGKRAKKLARLCVGCGTGIVSGPGGAKRCRPCAADRLQETIAANRLKYKAARISKSATTNQPETEDAILS